MREHSAVGVPLNYQVGGHSCHCGQFSQTHQNHHWAANREKCGGVTTSDHQ